MSELIIPEMCDGCGWAGNKTCRVIREPGWIYKRRNGKCFARVTPERVKEIESEIKEQELERQRKEKIGALPPEKEE